jgi:hypothetical protein
MKPTNSRKRNTREEAVPPFIVKVSAICVVLTGTYLSLFRSATVPSLSVSSNNYLPVYTASYYKIVGFQIVLSFIDGCTFLGTYLVPQHTQDTHSGTPIHAKYIHSVSSFNKAQSNNYCLNKLTNKTTNIWTKDIFPQTHHLCNLL